MANTINYAEKYVPLLDAKYKQESKTAVLDIDNDLLRESEMANTIYIPKMTIDGLGDYSRSTGFPEGSTTFEWESHTLTQDRANEFNIDRVDNQDTLDMAFGRLTGEFIRLHVAPEVDAYRFAQMAAGAGTTVNADLDSTDTVEAIDTAMAAMDDAEVPEEGRILFVTPSIYKNIKQSDLFDRNLVNVGDMTFDAFDNMPVIKVPQSRFYTGITLNDGSSSFGYAPIEDGSEYEINFMIVHQNAVLPVPKLEVPKTFSPDVNQDKDAWKFQFRLHHDIFVPDNKTDGIYVHTAGTALT